ncbi:mRNA cleavage and polyadenylation factor subunit [Pleurotus ostreatus]|nr:mRNA cleavage and polyadenylation factor subunit [Pleurotus ostreatus]
MGLHALHQEILPPSGVEFVVSLKLTPSTTQSSGIDDGTKVLCNVVVARTNLLRIFEVREQPPPTHSDEERDKKAKVRKGTEAVEGEVEMDEHGEGFINIAQSTGQKAAGSPTVTRLYFVREHKLHGIVTGLEAVRTLASIDDHLERLVVSFKDAKIALLEWSEPINDLQTVSIHTYERAPQLLSFEPSSFTAKLRSDPESRCVALSLPKDAIAILPFHQSQVDVDMLDPDPAQIRDIPYSPSFILDLGNEVDDSIRNVIDFTFLPGYNNPTLAVLFQTQQTWTGRMKEYKDTTKLMIFTLDLVHQHYPIISSVTGLPYDAFALLPCATLFAGVTILTGNAVIYVDASRRVALPVNGWAPRSTDMPLPNLSADEQTRSLHLEGSRAVFVDDKTLFVILKDGTIYPVELIADGKTVSKLIMGDALAQTTIPAAVRKLDDKHVFIGSTAGASVILRASRVEEEIEEGSEPQDASKPAVVADTNDTMDFDDDDDIYGVSTSTKVATANGSTKPGSLAKQTRTVIHLALCDSLLATGSISDITFSLAKNGERIVPELVAATGAGPLGGFTLFQRDLPSRTKRKLHAIGGARGVWSLPIRQSVKASGISYERPANPYHAEHDTLVLSTDANPSPGVSRIAVRSAKTDVAVTTRIAGTTVGAAPFFQRTAVLHVMSNSIRVLEPDGSERQAIKDLDGNLPRPKIRACSICDPFVLIFREDDSIGLFIGETERGKIRRKDMSAMGDKTSRYLTGCFFVDTTGLFSSPNHQPPPATQVGGKGSTTTLQAAVNAGSHTQWLLLVRPQGVMEIWSLPKLALVFSTSALLSLQPVLHDSGDAPALSLPQDPPRKPQDMDIEQVLVAPIGETSPKLHLFVFIRSGQLTVYEVASSAPVVDVPATRATSVNVKFVKVLSRAFEIQRNEEVEKSVIAEQKRISRTFIPFITSPAPGVTLSGVFFTGDRPSWLLATDKSAVQIYPSGHGVVHSFTSCSLWESKGDFFLYTDEGPSLMEWMPDFILGGPLPMKPIPKGRPYSNVIFDPSTSLIVAASSLQAKFASFDEDGNCIWEPDAPNITAPMCDCSTLELISPELWVTMDGYEFATNEFINSVCCVSLETSSTESGIKDFIAVGTSIVRGEDLAVKGATYIFEIVEVVADASLVPSRWYKLRLRCRDDAKGPVTALCAFNGYLVSSMGQKIFVRALDLDERLVGVAFLDVGVYVTSLKALKNLLLIGDAVKSVSFVAFQEDPYKLVVLAKDIQHVCVTNVDFFFADENMSIVTCDEDGVIRTYEYDPHDPESRDGRQLLLRTEFNAQVGYNSSVLTARRTSEDPVIPQSKLICGYSDGSISSLTPVEESAFKRLQLLQGQLTRNLQHMAGLNPRALRIVRNDHVSRPLARGILDGLLIAEFECLSISKQEETTTEIGTERSQVLHDWIDLISPW